jgi:alpha-mannosidase
MRYQQKHLHREVLMSFDYGDGGGGPTRDMLETQRRFATGIPGCPRTRMSTARHFFETLNQHIQGSKDLPVWHGELYLEYHRGTYTSMARNKI